MAEFNFRYRDCGVRHGYCRECGKELTRRPYKRKKRSYLKRNLRAYAERRQLMLEAKSRPCTDCGVQYPSYVTDFDHGDGRLKEFSPNSVHRVTKRAILREIENATWCAPTVTGSRRAGGSWTWGWGNRSEVRRAGDLTVDISAPCAYVSLT